MSKLCPLFLTVQKGCWNYPSFDWNVQRSPDLSDLRQAVWNPWLVTKSRCGPWMEFQQRGIRVHRVDLLRRSVLFFIGSFSLSAIPHVPFHMTSLFPARIVNFYLKELGVLIFSFQERTNRRAQFIPLKKISLQFSGSHPNLKIFFAIPYWALCHRYHGMVLAYLPTIIRVVTAPY